MSTSRLLRLMIIGLPLIALTIALAPPIILLQGGQGCPLPSDIAVGGVTGTSVQVMWSPMAPEIDSVAIEIRRAGSGDWDTVFAQTSPVMIDTLTPCTRYQVRLRSACDGEDGTYSGIFEFESDNCCRVPSFLRALDITETTARLVWDDVIKADTFTVRYRPVGSTAWSTLKSVHNSVILAGLAACSAYEVGVRSECPLGENSGYSSSILVLTTDCGACTNNMYCVSRAYDGSRFWIDSISFGNLIMKSGSDGGYLAYTTEKLVLERSRSYNLHISPGIADETCPLIYRAWLDLDLDGEFNDSTELLLDEIDDTNAGVTATISLADTLDLDITRLRIALKPWSEEDTIRPGACDLFTFGEVEDYCVRIDDVCPVAENLDTLVVSETDAVITWDVNGKALGFIYQYRELGESEWGEPTLTEDTVVTVGGLTKCKTYEFQLIQVCIQDTTNQVLTFDTKCSSSTVDPDGLTLELALFPNPTPGDFTLKLTTAHAFDGHFLLAAPDGRVIAREPIEIAENSEYIHTYSGLRSAPPGMYFVILTDGGRSVTSKVVKVE